jgi:hypothetical protein
VTDRPAWAGPSWLTDEDREREEQLVQALRAVVRAIRMRAEEAEVDHEFVAWRWRVDALLGEVRDMERRLLAPHQRENAA